MQDLIRQLFENYPVLGTVLSGLIAAHALAVFVVNLTPTPVDDRWVGRVYKVVEWVAGVTNSSKALPGEDGIDVDVQKNLNRERRNGKR